MHPFVDGNGRTARALEALMLQRAGLRDSSFIAMSNYYYYAALSNPLKALVRDINSLNTRGAVKVERLGEGRYRLGVRLEWPTEITETAFFEKLKQLPKAKIHSFLR